jgi:tyrosinase
MLRFAALLALVFLQLAAGVVGSPTPVPGLDKRAGACSFIRVRKEWRALTASEKQNFISSVLCLQSRPSKVVGKAGVKTRFDEFQACHIDLTDEVHQVGHFLAWHRHFITMFDKALRDECGFTGIMPYWDWSIDADSTRAMKDSPIYDPTTGFGGDGVSGTYTLPPDPNGQSSAFPFAYKGCVRTGPFANQTVRLGPGRLVTEHCLVRGIDEASKQTLATSQVNRVMQLTPFERFRTGLENGIAAGFGFGIHGGGHQAVGGEMLNPYSSPADPLFYLHHGNLDRLWWQWQRVDRATRMFDISGPTTQRPPFTNVTLDFQMTFTTLGPLVPVREIMDTETQPSCFVYQ